jgi:hypothetical protein
MIRAMYRHLARLLLWLFIAALPLQGALAAIRACAADCTTDSKPIVHHDRHDRGDAHDKADNHGKCGASTSCCAGAVAPPAASLNVAAPDVSFSLHMPGQLRLPGFVPDTPRRPPRVLT